MRAILRIGIIAGVFVAMNALFGADIVIAIRYLQAEGTSHSHLYLYREDGRLLRQLTHDDSVQDLGPIFAPDGSVIVFMRQKSNNVREFWSVDSSGKRLKQLDVVPSWYSSAKSSTYFTNVEPGTLTSSTPSDSSVKSSSPIETPTPRYRSPDDSVELILREDPKNEDDQVDGPGHGKSYLLRLKDGTETEFGKIPGFYGVFSMLHENQGKDRHFLLDGPLRLAFFDLHLNSTDGDTVFALDLTCPRLVRLSPNWATPIPLPGEAAFLTLTENRYVPIPGTKKTANCSYMERWNEKLNKVRYARDKAAARCYGASMYRPGKSPSIITLRSSAD